MKALIAWVLVLWFAVVLEHSRPELFASCSLVLPAAVACVLWHQNSLGMIVGSAALLLRWLASAGGFPIEVVVLLVGTSVLLTRRIGAGFHGPIRMSVSRIVYWGGPVLLAGLSLVAHAVFLGNSDVPAAVVARAVIAGPLLAGLLVLMRTTEELGLRRRV